MLELCKNWRRWTVENLKIQVTFHHLPVVKCTQLTKYFTIQLWVTGHINVEHLNHSHLHNYAQILSMKENM